ncbi:hypothetical protein K7432_008322 [Basidiobolus ranarum]|uniref:SH3 domain-containing protein n=1 Tax=Basidiobolus ranarum TaxID=34480 RepID=A0ABR2VYT0_9FUNG
MKLHLPYVLVTALSLLATNLSLVSAINPTVVFSDCAPSFVYKGVQYQGCTETDNQGKPWCFLRQSTLQDNWGYCQEDTIPVQMGSFNGQDVECDITSDAGNGTVVHGCFSALVGPDKTLLCHSSKVNSLVRCNASKLDTPPKKPLSAHPSENLPASDEIKNDQISTGSQPSSTKISTGTIGGIVAVVVVGVAGLALLMYRRQQSKKYSKSQLSGRYSSGYDTNIFEDAKLPPPHLQKTYTVVNTYTPTLGDELEIYPGDQVTVIVEYDDGWVQGINETRGRVKGVFPKHCVELISESTSLA